MYPYLDVEVVGFWFVAVLRFAREQPAWVLHGKSIDGDLMSVMHAFARQPFVEGRHAPTAKWMRWTQYDDMCQSYSKVSSMR